MDGVAMVNWEDASDGEKLSGNIAFLSGGRQAQQKDLAMTIDAVQLGEWVFIRKLDELPLDGDDHLTTDGVAAGSELALERERCQFLQEDANAAFTFRVEGFSSIRNSLQVRDQSSTTGSRVLTVQRGIASGHHFVSPILSGARFDLLQVRTTDPRLLPVDPSGRFRGEIQFSDLGSMHVHPVSLSVAVGEVDANVLAVFDASVPVAHVSLRSDGTTQSDWIVVPPRA